MGFDQDTLGHCRVSQGSASGAAKQIRWHTHFTMPASTSGICALPNTSGWSMRIQDLPRHLGQHNGGMVICLGQLNCVVPLERASMPSRTVVQCDKADCIDLGIIKVDLLGLGMVAILKDCVEDLHAWLGANPHCI